MRNWTALFFSIIIIFVCKVNLTAQNDLHLVGTITGISEQNKIYYAKGAGDINSDGYVDFIVNFNSYTNLYYGSFDAHELTFVTKLAGSKIFSSNYKSAN